MTEENLTPDEIEELQKFLGGGNAPSPEEKYSMHKFLHDVSESDDTTKTGFLNDSEIGTPNNPIRTFKGLALISKDILDNQFFVDHFLSESEIITSTSLSKNAKLINLAVVQRRQIENVSKERKKRGLFGKKEDKEDQEE